MLPSSHRVSRTLFEKTMKESKVLHTPHLSVRIGLSSEQSPSTPLGTSRFSFIISKKVDKRATKRNSIRRKGYVSLAHLMNEVKPGIVGLFFAKKGAEALSQADLEQEIRELFARSSNLIS